MIVELPTARQFQEVGVALLNTAWSTATTLLVSLREFGFAADDTDFSAEIQDFWDDATLELNTALSLAYQGGEFLLKARIADVSPYLLISQPPKQWPRRASRENVSFSEFRTLDAQDLVRVCDTVCESRLPADFVTEFEELRRKRNIVVHTYDSSLKVHATEVLHAIFLLHHTLVAPCSWIPARRRSIEQSPGSAFTDEEYMLSALFTELELVVEHLSSDELNKYLGVTPESLGFQCPACSDKLEQIGHQNAIPFARLVRADSSLQLSCLVCENVFGVIEQDCKESPCTGKFAFADDLRCLECNS